MALRTSAYLTERPIPCETLAFIVLSYVNFKSLKAGSFIILNAKPRQIRGETEYILRYGTASCQESHPH